MPLTIVFSLKSNLSDVRIATPAFYWGPLAWKMGFHPFIVSLNVSLGSKWASCRPQMDGSCLFIQSAPWWHFMGPFRPFTLRLIIERYDFNDAILPVKSFSIVTFCSVSLSGLFTFIEPPLIAPVGLVSWLWNWSMTGDSGRSLFLHQFWMTALQDKGSLAACFSL